MNADTVRELLSNATPGEWYAEDSERFWQLFAQRVMPLPADAPDDLRGLMPRGFEGHPMQLLKAPKSGTPYAEYWPESGDAALIAAAPAVAQWGLDQAQEAARLREALTTLLDLHDHPPDPDQRSALALLAWMNARAALEGTA